MMYHKALRKDTIMAYFKLCYSSRYLVYGSGF